MEEIVKSEERRRIDEINIVDKYREEFGEAKRPVKLKGSAKFHALLKEIGDLHDKKQKDYGRDDDPFANVRASGEWGLPAWVGAMVRATDKVRRLQSYATSGELSNEGARDSFMDLSVYALIALILWEEDNE